MVELELVGLSEDGTQLVLADAAGDEFAVPMDGRLRAVVRGDRVRSGQLETSMDSAQVESALRPRDIQARIRAGETAEAVAEIAQVPVDRVMAYAVPVMAERQHIAQRAQGSAVRRKHVDGPAMQLWDAVAERLRTEQVAPEAAQWDAWRREDGRWTVSVRYRCGGGERTGTFVFDALSRYAVADDDEGRRLIGERGDAAQPRAKGSASGRRLSAVASEYDAMLFDDDEPTADLTAVADVLGDHEERDEPRRHPRSEPEPDQPEDDADEPAHVDTADTSDAPRARQRPKPEKRGRRGRGRASVPSWDEIMFGQPKG
jgi:hypothetical protein